MRGTEGSFSQDPEEFMVEEFRAQQSFMLSDLEEQDLQPNVLSTLLFVCC